MTYLVADKYKSYTQVGEPYDKNGKQYIRLKRACTKCGGSGYYANFGVCYKCNGSGYSYDEARVYTEAEYEAYLASLERKRTKREEEKRNQEFELLSNSEINKKEVAEKLGFNSETLMTYIPVGNTYEIKDTLKSSGYKYHPAIGWHGPAPNVSSVNHVSISFEKLYEWYPLTKYAELRPEAEDLVQTTVQESFPPLGEYVGEVGNRFYDYDVRLDEARLVCDGTCNFYKFTTVNGKSTIIWLTSSYPKVKETKKEPAVGSIYHLTATVKSHEINNGEKVTKINRAIIKE